MQLRICFPLFKLNNCLRCIHFRGCDFTRFRVLQLFQTLLYALTCQLLEPDRHPLLPQFSRDTENQPFFLGRMSCNYYVKNTMWIVLQFPVILVIKKYKLFQCTNVSVSLENISSCCSLSSENCQISVE